MVTVSQMSKHHLQPLNTHWHNRSLSSLSATSEAATFHSALAHHHSLSNVELRQLTAEPRLTKQPSIIASLPISPQPIPSPEFTAVRMDRQDSGYSESPATPASDSRRTSTSSTGKRSSQYASSKSKRRSTASSSIYNPTRPSTKRSSRSSAQLRTSNPGTRPSIQARHTTPYPTQVSQPYQFFQFPSLADSTPPQTSASPSGVPNAQTETQAGPLPHPPPATIQYWTSDSTRRLEYAAIDAASKGVRGFFIKLLPDCILPASTRRTKFHEDDGDSDAGSVRRYRLALPEEKECCMGARIRDSMRGERPRGMLRRWTSFGKRGASMD